MKQFLVKKQEKTHDLFIDSPIKNHIISETKRCLKHYHFELSKFKNSKIKTKSKRCTTLRKRLKCYILPKYMNHRDRFSKHEYYQPCITINFDSQVLSVGMKLSE